ncbi:MAG: PAS domain S-box protein, partial [Anaerolineales bacterium]
ICRDRDHCLHLVASSGRYTHTDSTIHGRVPFGYAKIGSVAAGVEPKFITNDVTHDPHMLDHEWAKALNLTSFAGYRLLASDGQPAGVLGLFSQRIITDEKDSLLEEIATTASHIIQAENAADRLQESQALFLMFMEHVPVHVFIKDDKSRTLFVNGPMIQSFNASTWIGKTVAELFPKQFADSMLADDQLTLQQGLRSVDEDLPVEDGTIRSFHTTKFRIDRENNAPLIGGIATDITMRKLAEEKLRQSEERLQTILAAMPVLLVAFNAHGSAVYVNEVCELAMGYDSEEFIGHRSLLHTILPNPADRRQFLMLFRAENGQQHYEGEITRKDGTHRRIAWTRIRGDTRIPGWSTWIVGVDVTDRQLAIELRQRTQELLKANADLQKSKRAALSLMQYAHT